MSLDNIKFKFNCQFVKFQVTNGINIYILFQLSIVVCDTSLILTASEQLVTRAFSLERFTVVKIAVYEYIVNWYNTYANILV